jgi:hypothetical protein
MYLPFLESITQNVLGLLLVLANFFQDLQVLLDSFG